MTLNDYIETSFAIIDSVEDSIAEEQEDVFKLILNETDLILPHSIVYKNINSLNKICQTIEFQGQKTIISDINLWKTFRDLTCLFFFPKDFNSSFVYSFKLLSEQMYIQGELSLSKVFRHDYEKNNDIFNINQNNDIFEFQKNIALLQSVFALTHELIHIDLNYDLGKRKEINNILTVFKKIKDKWEEKIVSNPDAKDYLNLVLSAKNVTYEDFMEKLSKEEQLEMIENFIKKEEKENKVYIEYIKNNLDNKNLAEECVCDMMACTTVLTIGIKYFKLPLPYILDSIVMAYENLSLLDYIKRLESGFREDYNMDLGSKLRGECLMYCIKSICSISNEYNSDELFNRMVGFKNNYNSKVSNKIRYNLHHFFIEEREKLKILKELLDSEDSSFISDSLDSDWNYGGKFY